MAVVSLALPAAPVAAAQPEPTLSTGPHATPPKGAELARLAALHQEPPTDEVAGDVSTMVVTHTVYVKYALDEEWRAFYPGIQGGNVASSAIESADNAMTEQFGIDLVVHSAVPWDSSPDGGNINACGLLNDLKADLSPGGAADVLIGFSKNYSTNYQGCAEIGGDEALLMWHFDGPTRWKALQHEVSHLFEALDRYPDGGDWHTNDVMEDPYLDPNTWCNSYPFGMSDWHLVNGAAANFD